MSKNPIGQDGAGTDLCLWRVGGGQSRRSAPDQPRGPGFTTDGRVVAPDGRIFGDRQEVNRDRAADVLAEEPVIQSFAGPRPNTGVTAGRTHSRLAA